MKRAGGLFARIWAYGNLVEAGRRAQAGKRYRPDVLRFNFRQEDALHRLSRAIRDGVWRPGGHRHFRIYEPKARWISAAPYADRVVHHAICNIIEPELEPRLIFDCWANRSGKGSHRAVLRYQQFANRFRYVLKLDIQQYFPSIDHAILKAQLRRVFREPNLLALLDAIVDDGRVPAPHDAWFAGDDLLTPLERPKGLPIGNLTSQVWANTYLGSFDHWVKQRLQARAYLRFVDDFVLLHDDKSTLIAWREAIRERLTELRLRVHPRKCVIRRTAEGVPFLGYVIWPDRIRVRGETVRRYRRRLRHQDAKKQLRSLAAWQGHVRLAGSWREPGKLCRGNDG